NRVDCPTHPGHAIEIAVDAAGDEPGRPTEIERPAPLLTVEESDLPVPIVACRVGEPIAQSVVINLAATIDPSATEQGEKRFKIEPPNAGQFQLQERVL